MAYDSLILSFIIIIIIIIIIEFFGPNNWKNAEDVNCG